MKPTIFEQEKEGASLSQIRPLPHRKGSESRVASIEPVAHQLICVYTWYSPRIFPLLMDLPSQCCPDDRQFSTPLATKKGLSSGLHRFQITCTKAVIGDEGYKQPSSLSGQIEQTGNQMNLSTQAEPYCCLTEQTLIQPPTKKCLDTNQFQAFAHPSQAVSSFFSNKEEVI